MFKTISKRKIFQHLHFAFENQFDCVLIELHFDRATILIMFPHHAAVFRIDARNAQIRRLLQADERIIQHFFVGRIRVIRLNRVDKFSRKIRNEAAGFDVLLDDRDERPGVKFKDADLVGIPFRVTVGKKVTEGTVEVVQRSTREIRDASIIAITEYFAELLRPAH